MSSDLRQPIGSFDINIIRNALRHAGFRYEEPLCELDRGAARHAITLYQKGVHRSGELISAVNLWADKAVLARLKVAVRSRACDPLFPQFNPCL